MSVCYKKLKLRGIIYLYIYYFVFEICIDFFKFFKSFKKINEVSLLIVLICSSE